MTLRRLGQYGLGIISLGTLSTLIGIATGITLHCELAGCPPSVGYGFQGIGVQGFAVVYYKGCNACTISYWVVFGVLLVLVGTIMFSGEMILKRRSGFTELVHSEN